MWGEGIRIGKAVLPAKHETKHILLTGSTGSGKTNAIHHMIPQLREKKRQGVIVDTTGDYIARYYDPARDFILNPFDRRSQGWHPWAEILQQTDYKAVARCFLPLPEEKHHPDRFWNLAASSIFESLLKQTSSEENVFEFKNLLLSASLEQLHSKLEGTKGAPYVAKEGEKTAHSIRATLSSNAECLEHLRETQDPFSISYWIRSQQKDSFLFLSCLESQRSDLIPLLSAWLGIAIKALMSLGKDYNRRVAFICDEFAAMGPIAGITSLLREGRKYGACAILATQNPSQIDSIYGKSIAEDIFSNLRTKLVFAEEEPKIAKRLSQLFGEKEEMEAEEGISYGAHEMRDGVTQSMRVRNRPVITSTQIQELKDNQCFLKLCGGEAIEKLHFNYIDACDIAEPFEAREDGVEREPKEEQPSEEKKTKEASCATAN